MYRQKILNKILIPLDGSKNSLRGLKFTLDVAKQSSLSIIGLNVYAPSIFVKTSIAKQKSKEIIQKAELISQKAKVPFLGVSKVSDNVGRVIVTFSKCHKVDLTITGSRGPDLYHELFLDSVANYLVNKSKIHSKRTK